ncbi:bis-aminopropyl spermidine synthase family protein [Streptomonospora sp. S1-112]|uniref:Bis-aminopropyl spermidine synthase family protein n=1 Tax=Streptomonospora mangrovi TaxID=2883123 RepID=A0A9X3SJJ1_9ACTN|nr:bis-aminopropyl spermidine synthase family protein [Streptomonospora mangrovi]MDA0567404.1 bis-aminopropyl spermidine synthase family protein [Streptomonospora mangrovi]
MTDPAAPHPAHPGDQDHAAARRPDAPPARPRSALDALLAEHGITAPRLHRVLGALSSGGWWTPRALVRDTAVAHRLVQAVLEALGEEAEWDAEGRVRLRAPRAFTRYARPPQPDPLAPALAGLAAAEAEITRLVEDAPPPLTDLDHVTATPRTALRRAALLGRDYSLAGARLLCVGDHDLTALAATLVNPGLEAVVVDIDERILAYVDAAADRLGLPVRCHFADLRLGLPAAVRGTCDLAFTDPPYTPEGVELFLRRALEGLSAPQRGRVLLAYGASETTPALAAKVQQRLARLGLVTEALWPEFHRYLGAEAIGAAADLYVLRPTTRTPAAPSAGPARARVYSRGANAAEAAGSWGAEEARAALERAAPDTLVGDWPALGDAAGDGAGDTAGVTAAPRRVRLETWLESPVAAERAVLNLTGGWAALLPRAVLAAAGPEVYAVVPSSDPRVRDQAGQRDLAALLAPRFEVRFLRGTPGPRLTLVHAAERAPAGPAEEVLAHCLRRAHGTLTATLREGLQRAAAAAGAPVNKRTARLAVAEAAPWLRGHTPLDLPEHRFADLRAAAERLAAPLAAPPPV